jgi:ElaB/YqjD/DUF883 family membrane-anchored ribosome-binding protein
MGEESEPLNDVPAGDPTEDIREDIEQRRAQMSETIDAIQDRLNPKRLMNDAKETVRAAAVGKVIDMMNSASESASGLVGRIKENPLPAALIGLGAWWLYGRKENGGSRPYRGNEPASLHEYKPSGGSDIVRTLKDHPLPAALAGLGLGWWLLDRQRPSADRRYGSQEYGTPGYGEPASNYGGGGGRASLGHMAHDAKEAVAGLADRAKQGVSDLTDRTKESVSELTDRAQDRVGELTDRTQTEFDRLLRDNPLALGVVALAVGAAIGLAVPETRAEQEMMGETRDRLINTAREAADEAVEKVQQAVGELQQGDVGLKGTNAAANGPSI